jgi:O-antigen ligase
VNCYDIANPFALIPAQSEFAVLGRATGLYGNPNQAGAALVLGFILTITLVPSRWRALYLSYVGIGIALTLSRSALLGFALVVLALVFTTRLMLRQVALATAIWLVAGWLTAAYVLPVFAQQLNLDPQVIIDRLTWIIDPVAKADFSQLERAYVADLGWGQFLSSPIFGNGIGSTELWAARSSTHNQYLLLLSDFGVLGAAVIPALLLATLIGPSARAVPERWAFAAFIALFAAASHNVLTEYYMLLAFATMAAMCAVPGGDVDVRRRGNV